jgi:DNA-binding response OmpR family regulator
LIVNCSAAGFDFAKLAKRVRASLELADATLVAVVEPHNVAHAETLRAAGYDGVLVKPFLLDELDALLAAV